MRLSHGLLVLVIGLAASGPVAAVPTIRSVDPDKATGTAAAVVVAEDAPLAHTAQLLPLDAQGAIVGKGDAVAQTERVLDRLDGVLREVQSGLDRAVKLNVSVANPAVTAAVKTALARRFQGDVRPAVSFVAGALPHTDALVAVDAVAVAKTADRALMRRRDVTVLPPGARVYVAGQAEKGADLAEATRKTLGSLRATLQHLGLGDEHVVQVKSFLKPMSEVGIVEKEVRAFYGDKAPPQVFVEWTMAAPIEIELIAAAGPGQERGGEAIEYLTPPGMQASPVYSRVARINHGPTIYSSGLYGKGKTGAAEIESIFTALGGLLEKTNSDLRHLAKATYYVSTDEVSKSLNELRPRWYDPKRPPSASKAMVTGTGVAGTTITLDMIAVPVSRSRLNEYGKAEYGHGLTPEEAAAGWLSLFDGTTTFGWIGARVEDGMLRGGTTTTEFGPSELRLEAGSGGIVTIAGKEIALRPGVLTPVPQTAGRGPIQLGEGVALKKGLLRPLGLKTLFNGVDLDGWKRIDRAGLSEERRPDWRVANGWLHALGGPGAVEYQGSRFGDLVLQLEVRTGARHANGGVFFRSIPGDFMNGYEMQIHNRCEGGDPGKPSVWSTGGIDDRQNCRRLVSRDNESFTETVIAHGPHIATWVNGYQVTDWTDTRPRHENARRGLRTEPGTIQLQAHDPLTDVQFRNLRAAEWR